MTGCYFLSLNFFYLICLIYCEFDLIFRYFGIDTNDDERLENMVYKLTDKFVLDILELKKFLGKLLFRFCGNFPSLLSIAFFL